MLQNYFPKEIRELKNSEPVVEKNFKIHQDSKFVKLMLEIENDSILTVLRNKPYKDIPIYKINEFKVSKGLTLKNLGLEWGEDLVLVGFNLQW